MVTQSRFSSGALWITLVALTIALLTYLGMGGYIPPGVDIVATAVVTGLTFLGILTNPKDGRWFWSPHTPWKTRLTDFKTWIGIIAVVGEIVAQILKWLGILTLPFALNAALLTFLTILQAVGVINGVAVDVSDDVENIENGGGDA